MEVFEVHITGDEKIHEVSRRLGLKTISIDLLRPDRTVLRVEHMTSQIFKFENYEKCHAHVQNVVDQLLAADVDIERVKIECPDYKHYREQSLYMESHFQINEPKGYPTSKNQKIKKEYYDYNELRDYLQDKYNYDEWDYAGKYSKRKGVSTPEGEVVPYLDFWHWVVENYDIHNGCYITFHSERFEEIGENKGWIKEIYKTYISSSPFLSANSKCTSCGDHTILCCCITD